MTLRIRIQDKSRAGMGEPRGPSSLLLSRLSTRIRSWVGTGSLLVDCWALLGGPSSQMPAPVMLEMPGVANTPSLESLLPHQPTPNQTPVLPQDDWPLSQGWPGHRLNLGLLHLETAMRKEGQNPTCEHGGEGGSGPESGGDAA